MDYELFKELNKHRCPGRSPMHQHEPCAGQLTKPAEGYNDKMVRVIHSAWKTSCINRGCKPIPAAPSASVDGGGVFPRPYVRGR